jgi:hypothetical protein
MAEGENSFEEQYEQLWQSKDRPKVSEGLERKYQLSARTKKIIVLLV